MRRLGYCWERVYPHAVALLAVFLVYKFEVDVSSSDDFKELLNGLVTLESIIIGFIGTIMPVILSMKNESKFVKYVFEHDEKNLFSKYLKSTVLIGLLSAFFALCMHVRDTIPQEQERILYYAWIYITVTFLVCTYRSMTYMITLIFTKDEECFANEILAQNSEEVPSDRELELKDKFSKKS